MIQATHVQLNAPFDPTPFRVFGPPDDKGVIGEIQRSGGRYEPGVMRVLQQVLGPDSVAFDIGANIGVFALVMARLSPRGRVYAFEPAAETFEYLVKNLEANGARHAVAEQAAAYDVTGPVPFVFSPVYPPGSFVSQLPVPEGVHRMVEAVRLDDYIERHGIGRVDLIMVDAEGAELAVLRGAERTLAGHRPALILEVNPVLLRRFGGASSGELMQLLTGEGGRYDLYSIQTDGRLAEVQSYSHLDLILRREGVTDIVFLPAESRRPRGARRRGAAQLSALEAEFAGAGAPAVNFVVEPAFELTPPGEPVAGGPGMSVTVTVAVRNTSPYWFSSDFLYYPVHVSYRWYNAQGEPLDVPQNRGRFAPPLGPGQAQMVTIPVALPPLPGEYQLALTLVQENYAWFDDVDPALQLRVRGVVG